MEPSTPLVRLVVLEYQKLLQHFSSSPSQSVALPWRNSEGECCWSENGVVEMSSSELSDGISEGSRNSKLAMEKERDLLVADVMAALGPSGFGLLAVRGVPEMAELRKGLLPLAKKLALMSDAARRPVLKNYGLSTDVPLKRPDRPVSAFATKLQYNRHSHVTNGSSLPLPSSKSSPSCLCDVSNSKDLSRESQNLVRGHSGFEQLGSFIQQLGACMVEVGLLIARICDSAISHAHLEDAIWESGSMKARLIHYHASAEKDLMSHSSQVGNGFISNQTSRKLSKIEKHRQVESTAEPSSQTVQAGNPSTAAERVNTISEDLWQEWHYDYGFLTVLTAPMFLASPSLGSTDSSPEFETYPGGHSGLSILYRGVRNLVNVSTDCLIVQVGEAAQIASGGKLAAVAHCVCRPPTSQIYSSRETFVTFLQPAWDRVLNPPIGVTRAEVLNPEGLQQSKTTSLESQEGKGEVLEETRPELVFPRPTCKSEGGDCDGAIAAVARNLEIVDKCTEFLPQPIEGKGYTQITTVVPSLDSRWKEGYTFAEFSRETTAQYYGAQGRQSQRTGHPSAG